MSCVFGSTDLRYCRGEGWVISVNLPDYPKVNAERGLGAPATSDIGEEAPAAFFSLSCATSAGPLAVNMDYYFMQNAPEEISSQSSG